LIRIKDPIAAKKYNNKNRGSMNREEQTGCAFPSIHSELRSLIIKLRWIGQEDEAEGLASRLARIAPQEAANLWPRETD
jgi:hypothetical protein